MEGIKPDTNLPQVSLVFSWPKILVCFFCILFFMQLTISCCVSQERRRGLCGVYLRGYYDHAEPRQNSVRR